MTAVLPVTELESSETVPPRFERPPPGYGDTALPPRRVIPTALNWPLVPGTFAAPSTCRIRKAGAFGARVMVTPRPSKVMGVVIGGSPTGPWGELP